MSYLKLKKWLIIGVIASWVVACIAIAVFVIHNKVSNLTLDDVCPDYFQSECAYIVDESGRGMDSVGVTMRDNINFNTLYRSFTDSTGKFTLFNDFYSFALYNTPMSFELQLFISGYSDTVLYSFRKKRVCHFEKTSGPDTIYIIPQSQKYRNIITLADTVRMLSCSTFSKHFNTKMNSCMVLFGNITSDSTVRKAAVIDWGQTGFRDNDKIAIAVDNNQDSVFDTRPGSLEFFTNISVPVLAGKNVLLIDRISRNGTTLFLKWQRPFTKPLQASTVGALIDDLSLPVTSHITISELLQQHDYLLLYFYEDRESDFRINAGVSALVKIMNRQLGNTEIVGINRLKPGYVSESQMHIIEGLGWEGPLTLKLRNETPVEIICIDKKRKIVYRGKPDRNAVEKIWEKESNTSRESALAEFDVLISKDAL